MSTKKTSNDPEQGSISQSAPKTQEEAAAVSFEPNGKKWVEKLTEEDKEALRHLGEIGFSPS